MFKESIATHEIPAFPYSKMVYFYAWVVTSCDQRSMIGYPTGLGSSTVDQVLKYTKYPKYIPSTSTGQVLIFLKST